MSAIEILREDMVQSQLKNRGINDPHVLHAFSKVPRENFVMPTYHHRAYDDCPLPLPQGQTISQPYIVAYMTQALCLQSSDKVLEVGAGSAYAAAILSQIVTHVYAIERVPELVDLAKNNLEKSAYQNVDIKLGDGTLGWKEHAPFDAILVSAGGPLIPRTLESQLAIGGRMIIPVGIDRRVQNLVRITRESENEYRREDLTDVRFVPLVWGSGWEAHETHDDTQASNEE